MRRALVAVALLVAAACGGAGDDATGCPISREEIEAIVGAEVTGLEPLTGPGPTGCTAALDDARSIAVRVHAGAGEEAFAAFLDASPDATELEVLGRTAAWSPAAAVLAVVDGADGIEIDGAERRTAIDLAGVVLEDR